MIFEDDHKTELWFARRAGGLVLFVKTADDDEIGFVVADLPGVIREMCEKAGWPVPVILPAPERDAVLVQGPHGEELADVKPSPAGSPSNSPGVLLSLHDGSHRVTVRLVRDEPLTLACALASAMREAEAEPNPGDVEELATAIHRANCEAGSRCVRKPADIDRRAARAVLRAGYRRETGQ